MALSAEGDVYTWGNGKAGALGHGSTSDELMPKKVEGLSKIAQIACGSDYTMARDEDGKVFAFGNNGYGQLGISGNATKVTTPTQLFIPASQGRIVEIACGEEHSAYLDARGQVHTWGYGVDGQLGHNNKTSLNTPKRVVMDQKVTQVRCGGGHTGLLSEDGDLYLMGRGRDGQIGRGDQLESVAMNFTKPTLVDYFKTHNLKVEDFALGTNHSVALVSPRSKK